MNQENQDAAFNIFVFILGIVISSAAFIKFNPVNNNQKNTIKQLQLQLKNHIEVIDTDAGKFAFFDGSIWTINKLEAEIGTKHLVQSTYKSTK